MRMRGWLLGIAVVLGIVATPIATDAQEATSASGSDTPAPDECRAEPIPLAGFQSLATPGPTSTVPTVAGQPDTLPPGSPADALTVEGITATVREIMACVNKGEVLRAFSLYTEGFLRPIFGAESPASPAFFNTFYSTLSTPQATSPNGYVALVEVRDARILDDGRAAAIVVTDDPASSPPMTTSFLVFAKTGDRWQLDAAIELPPAGTLVP